MTAGKYPSHIFTHHTANDMKPYVCEVCSKGFGSKKSHREHMNIHNGLRPYGCKFCSSTFNR
jgi:KRAB domain-containing zinc finger protein